jgi:hypothetical protein
LVSDVYSYNNNSIIHPFTQSSPSLQNNNIVTPWVTGPCCSHLHDINGAASKTSVSVFGASVLSSPLASQQISNFFPTDFSNTLSSYASLLPKGYLPKSHLDVINFSRFESYLASLLPRFKPGGVEEATANAASGFCWNDHSDLVSVLNPSSSIESLLVDMREQSFIDQSRFTLHSALCFPNDPSFDLLCKLGTEGAIIDVDPSFTNQSIPLGYRKLEKQLQKVFSMHAVKAAKAKRGLILKTSTIPPSELVKLHFNPQFWTYKPDDAYRLF